MTSQLKRRGALIGICLVTAVGAAACGSSSSGGSSGGGGGGSGSATSASAGSTATSGSTGTTGGASTTGSSGSGGASVLGSPKPAKGSPITFGMISLESNAGADFPEVREAAQAAVKYVNAYRGGLDGHPIKLDICVTDGSPATSVQCANKLIAAHPTAILGGSDLAGANTLPLYKKAGLAYIGGVDFTPAESSAPNSVIFNDIAQSGNSDIGTYAVKTLHAKNIAVIALGDTQGTTQAKLFEIPAVTQAGGTAKLYSVPPSQADASSTVASALSGNPDAILLEDPSQCVSILSSLKSLGNTKPVLSIDPCSAPSVVKAAAGGAENMYWFQPFQDLFAKQQTNDVVLTKAIFAKYAPAKIEVDSPALGGLTTIMNLRSVFHSTPESKLKTAYMLHALRTGTHKAFLSTTWNCANPPIKKEPAICNADQYLYQIKNSTPTLLASGYHAGANIGG
jgi:branched-chain amino acid transport system substrate-binding protein